MNDVRRVLSTARRRLLVQDAAGRLVWTSSIAVGGLAATLLAQRILGLNITFPGDWLNLAGLAAGGALAGSALWAWIRRPSEAAVARAVDEAAGLRESISTALAVESSPDPWAHVVRENARAQALGVDLRRALPFAAPRTWPVPLAMGLGLATLWFTVPTVDALHWSRQRAQAEQARAEIVQVVAETKADAEKLQELARKAGLDLAAEATDPDPAQAGPVLSADEIRRAALKRLSSLQDKLAAERAGERAQQLEAMRQQLRQLRQPGPGPLAELSRALSRGEFDKARAELDRLQGQLDKGELSEAQRQQLKEQAARLAEQLQKLAEDRKALEQKLEQAGLSKEDAKAAARDPSKLDELLNKMPGIPADLQNALRQEARAQQKAGEQTKGMSGAMAQMGEQGQKQGDQGQAGQEGMGELAEQLGDLEQLQQDMDALDAAAQEAGRQASKLSKGTKGGQCNNPGEGEGDGEMAWSDVQSPWRAGESTNAGKGSGGPGQSGGGRGPEGSDAPVEIEKARSPVKTQAGPIIGSRLVFGEQVRGESQAEFAQAVAAAQQNAAKAMESMTVRRELQGAVKHYFGRLEARAQAGAPTTPAPAPAPTPAPK